MIRTSKTSQATDAELIARYKRKGHKRWVGELFNRYAHLVLGLCVQYLKEEQAAEDMCMSIFEKVMKELVKRDVIHFRSWLYTLSKNECLMELRRSGNPKRLQAAEAYTSSIQDTETDSKYLEELRLEALSSALKQLGAEQRICVERFYLKQQSYAEIAAATGFDLKQVKSYIQNGKRNLRITLTPSDAFKP